MNVSLSDMADRELVVMSKEQIILMLHSVSVTLFGAGIGCSYEVDIPRFIEVEEVIG